MPLHPSLYPQPHILLNVGTEQENRGNMVFPGALQNYGFFVSVSMTFFANLTTPLWPIPQRAFSA